MVRAASRSSETEGVDGGDRRARESGVTREILRTERKHTHKRNKEQMEIQTSITRGILMRFDA